MLATLVALARSALAVSEDRLLDNLLAIERQTKEVYLLSQSHRLIDAEVAELESSAALDVARAKCYRICPPLKADVAAFEQADRQAQRNASLADSSVTLTPRPKCNFVEVQLASYLAPEIILEENAAGGGTICQAAGFEAGQYHDGLTPGCTSLFVTDETADAHVERLKLLGKSDAEVKAAAGQLEDARQGNAHTGSMWSWPTVCIDQAELQQKMDTAPCVKCWGGEERKCSRERCRAIPEPEASLAAGAMRANLLSRLDVATQGLHQAKDAIAALSKRHGAEALALAKRQDAESAELGQLLSKREAVEQAARKAFERAA